MRTFRKKHKSIDMSINLLLKLVVICSIVTLFITVGFSSLSTSLSVNGSAKFMPVGMIRVMSIEQKSLTNVVEVEKGYTTNSINVIIDFENQTGVAVYDVNITNLGQTPQTLTQIVEDIYSNEDVEYELNGLAIDDVIEPGESKNFTITFKYKEGVENSDERLNAKLQFVFEEYVVPTTFPTVFIQKGACTFNGSDQNISGDECSKYTNKKYIDTGIALYSNENWKKDYEIGFTIDEFTYAGQENQAVFVNTKLEEQSKSWPGLVFRRGGNNNSLELTQYINKVKKAQLFSSNSMPMTVRIRRKDGVIYYSINDAGFIALQDMNNFNQQFDVTTWFGAAPNNSGVPMRYLKATMSNMYVKLGKIESNYYTIAFDANGGSVNESTRRVIEGSAIGALPTPTSDIYGKFMGWYLDSECTKAVDENTIVTNNMTLYAKWDSTIVAEINGVFYNSIEDAIASVPKTGEETTIIVKNDISSNISIDVNQNVVFDLQGHTFSNVSADASITNSGTLKITSGTVKSNSANTATINNNDSGVLIIDGCMITSSGNKQALYNNGGVLTIAGDSYIKNTSNIRSAVHNLNKGTLTITEGTIISTNHAGVNNESGTLVIGAKDGNISTTSPNIQGKTYGITANSNYSIYDGIIKGQNAAVNNQSKIVEIEDNSEITSGSEIIENKNYKTLYLNLLAPQLNGENTTNNTNNLDNENSGE
ncbi:MAG: hypothetical protein E7158_04035 [Firmicutes bacterium]|nr:hypothetical protein [Bacillota bacterium]